MDFGSAYVVTLILTCDLGNDEVRRREERWLIPPQSLHQYVLLVTVAFWCLWTNWQLARKLEDLHSDRKTMENIKAAFKKSDARAGYQLVVPHLSGEGC